jgi:hypothetical protein
MKLRWYDKDPTLSMAISLLQNASKSHQEMTARHALHYLERENLVDPAFLRTQDGRIKFIFPLKRRSKMDVQACRMLEIMKRMAPDLQQTMALQIINYIYLLDGGMEIPMPDEMEAGGASENSLNAG